VHLELLNAETGIISWDWQRFDSVVMLSELQEMITRPQENPTSLDRLIVKLQYPIPDETSTKLFTIPVVGKALGNSEWTRGRANVIAPFRLVATKFSVDDSEPIMLDIQYKLDKMGLTDSSNHVLQRLMTKVIFMLGKIQLKLKRKQL
jgi:hypothetical protein